MCRPCLFEKIDSGKHFVITVVVQPYHKVAADVFKASGLCIFKGKGGFVSIVNPAQSLQGRIVNGLHTNGQSVYPGRAETRQLFIGKSIRIGFQGYFSPWDNIQPGEYFAYLLW